MSSRPTAYRRSSANDSDVNLFRGRVEQGKAFIGPLVKVDLTAEWGDPVRVELSQERFGALALEPGAEVFVRPRDLTLFTT